MTITIAPARRRIPRGTSACRSSVRSRSRGCGGDAPGPGWVGVSSATRTVVGDVVTANRVSRGRATPAGAGSQRIQLPCTASGAAVWHPEDVTLCCDVTRRAKGPALPSSQARARPRRGSKGDRTIGTTGFHGAGSEGPVHAVPVENDCDTKSNRGLEGGQVLGSAKAAGGSRLEPGTHSRGGLRGLPL